MKSDCVEGICTIAFFNLSFMNKKLVTLLASGILFLGCENKEKEPNFVRYVDPLIGTAGHGHTFPGAIVPFGGIQPSPDQPRTAWDWCSGYHYSDSVISSFSHTHLSGTGIGDLQDIRFMPAIRPPKANETPITYVEANYSTFSHDNESVEPGFYQVKMDNGIDVQLAATARCAMHAYTYPKNSEHLLIMDLTTARNWDRTTSAVLKKVDDRTLQGYRFSRGWAADQQVYFTVEFSQNFSIYVGRDTFRVLENGMETTPEKGMYAWLDFGKSTNQILAKVSISSAGWDGAKANLNKELSHWSFDKVKRDAKNSWRRELAKIKVEGDNKEDLINFYTALYHAYTAPYLFSDVEGRYKGADGKVYQTESDQYTVFSLWDTFRAAHPLFTITQTERVSGMIQSMMNHFNQYGLLPVWELVGNETNCMIGHHGISVLAEAIMKEIPGFDYEQTYNAIKVSALSDRDGLKELRQHEYIPSDIINESVSKTLEYCYNFYCVARVAQKLGYQEDAQMFDKMAGYYKNHFDPKTGFMRGKTTSGQWREPFSPYFSNHREDDYTEGNAWQYSWYVPHDVDGLIALHGGKQLFGQKLDSLFQANSELIGTNVSPDISGLIGQYAHGNEPSHHTAYLFNYIGQNSKTQYYVNQILTTLYKPTPDGLCGNEDCGQMSAWYVMSAMGLYPVAPVDGEYQLTAPLFRKIRIKLGHEKFFVIKANKDSDKHIYIREVYLNRKKLDRNYITHQELMNGGQLEFILDTKPVN